MNLISIVLLCGEEGRRTLNRPSASSNQGGLSALVNLKTLFNDFDGTSKDWLTLLGIGLMFVALLAIIASVFISFFATASGLLELSEKLTLLALVFGLSGTTAAIFFSRRLMIVEPPSGDAVNGNNDETNKNAYRKFRMIKFIIDDLLGMVIFVGLGTWLYFSLIATMPNIAGWGLGAYFSGCFLFLIREGIIHRKRG